jgi:heptosyltransferase II
MPVEKVIFFHMNQLGDLMFSLPVLAKARSQWPDKKLYSFVRPQYVNLLKATDLLDEVIERPYNDMGSMIEALSIFRKESFDRAVLFSESPENYLMAFVAGIPQRFGFDTAAFSFILTGKVKRRGVPSLSNNIQLGAALGLTDIKSDYTGIVKIPRKYENGAKYWLDKENINKEKMVVIAPGASLRRKEKVWSKDNWAKVIKFLVKKQFEPVLIGSLNELVDLKAISDTAEEKKLRIFAPQNDLLFVAGIISKAKMFLGIDSGAMHLAASLNIPCIALFGPTDPKQVGPQPLAKHHIVQKSHMEYITPDDVIKEISKYE